MTCPGSPCGGKDSASGGRWPRTPACVSPERAPPRRAGFLMSHLCSARPVQWEGTEPIVGWSPWQQLMSLHQEVAGTVGGQELEGGGRAGTRAALPAALWKRLLVPPRSHRLGSLAPGCGPALHRGDPLRPCVHHGHVPCAA